MKKPLDVLKNTYEKNKKQVIVLAGAVVLLLILTVISTDGQQAQATTDSTKAVYSLESELEKKLEDFLSSVEGVGTVRVCVTFDILEQTSYAQNTETDSKENSSKTKTDYVIIDSKDGNEQGLAIAVRAPAIRGVAVACEGGASAAVRKEITSLVCSVLGISSNRVFVSQYKKSK